MIKIYPLNISSIVSFSVFAANNKEPDKNQLLLAPYQALATAPNQKPTESCMYFIKDFVAATRSINVFIINKLNNQLYKTYFTKSRIIHHFMYYHLPLNGPEVRLTKAISNQLLPKIDTLKALRDEILNALSTEYPYNKKQIQN